jgi:hypothetical protein
MRPRYKRRGRFFLCGLNQLSALIPKLNADDYVIWLFLARDCFIAVAPRNDSKDTQFVIASGSEAISLST